jgi:hypothetical protein
MINKGLKDTLKNRTFLFNIARAIWYKLKRLQAFIEAILFRLKNIGTRQDNFFRPEEFATLDELVSHLRKRRNPKFFLDSNPELAQNKAFTKTYRSEMLAEADKIIKHRFRILGREMCFDSDIDWHLDPQSGHRWPLRYFKRLLPVFNTDDSTDAKFPFELSRFTHLATLGIAFRISEDRKYAQEFIEEVNAWVDSNPYPRGVNWTCAMDVAIRLCNLITGFYLFKDSPEISDDFLKKYIKSLYQHGRYIVRNLEWGGNHYLSDIVGLLYCGVCFPELKEAEGWKRLAIREMVQEMEKQA